MRKIQPLKNTKRYTHKKKNKKNETCSLDNQKTGFYFWSASHLIIGKYLQCE